MPQISHSSVHAGRALRCAFLNGPVGTGINIRLDSKGYSYINNVHCPEAFALLSCWKFSAYQFHHAFVHRQDRVHRLGTQGMLDGLVNMRVVTYTIRHLPAVHPEGRPRGVP